MNTKKIVKKGRRPDQVLEKKCELCSHITYGATEKAISSGYNGHQIRFHNAKRIQGTDSKSRVIGEPGTLLYFIQNTNKTDMSEVIHLWSNHIRKTQRQEGHY